MLDEERTSQPLDCYEPPRVDELGPVEALTLILSA
ncbi:MAG: lasso RiPP family leader peptide-containing protein [Thermoleophilia bacterium]